ncbi:hypothetical protein MRX96_035550 [Rhipicephalus microplus]
MCLRCFVQVDPGGKADAEGRIRVGDLVLCVNEVPCSRADQAKQLVDSAFSTLTLLVWRSASVPVHGDQSPNSLVGLLERRQEVNSGVHHYREEKSAFRECVVAGKPPKLHCWDEYLSSFQRRQHKRCVNYERCSVRYVQSCIPYVLVVSLTDWKRSGVGHWDYVPRPARTRFFVVLTTTGVCARLIASVSCAVVRATTVPGAQGEGAPGPGPLAEGHLGWPVFFGGGGVRQGVKRVWPRYFGRRNSSRVAAWRPVGAAAAAGDRLGRLGIERRRPARAVVRRPPLAEGGQIAIAAAEMRPRRKNLRAHVSAFTPSLAVVMKAN